VPRGSEASARDRAGTHAPACASRPARTDHAELAPNPVLSLSKHGLEGAVEGST